MDSLMERVVLQWLVRRRMEGGLMDILVINKVMNIKDLVINKLEDICRWLIINYKIINIFRMQLKV
jgi:hypothetical protein